MVGRHDSVTHPVAVNSIAGGLTLQLHDSAGLTCRAGLSDGEKKEILKRVRDDLSGLLDKLTGFERTFHQQALDSVRFSPFVVIGCAIAYAFSVAHVQVSLGYQLAAAFAGVISFPVVRIYWRKRRSWPFFALIVGNISIVDLAQRRFLGLRDARSWEWPTAQFLSIDFGIVFVLIFIFRQQLSREIRSLIEKSQARNRDMGES
jgi:hypothetical protein